MVTATPAEVRTVSAPRGSTRVRTEIQALRAIAVGAVIVYHLWPDALPGGYIGVDVFFVVSGFLITGHLIREHGKHGNINLPSFWGRRIRRLLPSAITVLTATVIAVFLVVPAAYWESFLREVAASALIVENWALAASAVDYLAADGAASPVQHFWSLSVEEQFYLAWPVLLVALLAMDRSGHRIVVPAIAFVGVASLAHAWVLIDQHDAAAYFVTTARAWEFAAGALLAALAMRSRDEARDHRSRLLAQWWRPTLGIAGISVLLFVFWEFDSATAVPGPVTLVPVLATVAVIAAGDRHVGPLGRLYRLPGVQWLGAVSYTAYLWHWPLIVLVPFALKRDADAITLVAILVLTLVMAAATHRLVEERLRHGRGPVTWRTFVAAAAAVATVVTAAWVLAQRADDGDARPLAANQEACLGAQSWTEELDCSTVEWADVEPARTGVEDDVSPVYDDECRTSPVQSEVKTCEYGASENTADASVVLVGDSHAAQWFPAIEQVALQQNWNLTVYFKAACPFTDAASQLANDDHRDSCVEWNDEVLQRIARSKPDLVVTSATRAHEFAEDSSRSEALAVDGYAERWENLLEVVGSVVVLEDTPQMDQEQLRCLAASTGPEPDCQRDATEALARPAVLGAAADTVSEVRYLDVNPSLCDSKCATVISGAVVYRDTSSHMTETFARTLAPWLGTRLASTLVSAGS
ncbi:acyltransferase family protein [Demequina flava]|uniref:acyltransferase family protein n=1 Tax=Demequina flava TaxID=1095025 RepID=UPI000782BAD5|nr:acyltransferase family protein [Demequina flava]